MTMSNPGIGAVCVNLATALMAAMLSSNHVVLREAVG
jgi:hypothetical protein